MRLYAALIAAVAWVALGGQFYLITLNADGPELLFRTTNFFSFFTILSNILVALVTTATALVPRTVIGRVLMRPGVASAAMLYIGITSLTYFFVLRHLWQPAGLQFWVDAALHYATPILFLAFWLFAVIKGRLTLDVAPKMLVFPVLFAAYTLIRGPLAGWYPYPFLDAGSLGYGQVAANIFFLVAAFAALALLLVAIDRLIGRLRNASPAPPGV
jgi:hypothetical protein